MRKRRLRFLLLLLLLTGSAVQARQPIPIIGFEPKAGFLPLCGPDRIPQIEYDTSDYPVVGIAAADLQQDIQRVTGILPKLNPGSKKIAARIVAGTLGHSQLVDRLVERYRLNLTALHGQWEKFEIRVLEPANSPTVTILVVGSGKRATAYGLYELSRQMGVSPWYWWADVPVTPHKYLYARVGSYQFGPPDVQYRGIFINDEDFGLNPWSSKNFEPDARTMYPLKKPFKGTLGPKTYAKIFELLLRLRGNTIWPAMHEVTMPFYFVEGNREMAEKYGICIGSAHNEPLARNSATEWDLTAKGPYNYLTNKDEILGYWTERLKTLRGADNIFTIGMRGKHDSRMEGVRSTAAYKKALEEVIPEQRALLKKYINPDISQVPQMLIPYKELLEVYQAGLEVPEDVTLMWCDDNYGYITHFPDSTEQQRPGGNGVYYHVSYWGRPHDYLWLGTASPYLMQQQLSLAYQRQIRKIWILNVGDIKPAEYQLQLFMDMAWHMRDFQGGGVNKHMEDWLRAKFGNQTATRLLPIVREHYRLAYIHKPEFMGHTRTEEKGPAYRIISDLPWSAFRIERRLEAYKKLTFELDQLAAGIPDAQQDAFFELVAYSIQAAAAMNRKLLMSQLARHAAVKDSAALWQQSDAAYEQIKALTRQYNELAGGKWKGIMSFQPRRLAVFEQVPRRRTTVPLVLPSEPVYTFNGADFVRRNGTVEPVEGLGYQGKAVALKKGSWIEFEFPEPGSDSLNAAIHLLPNHPVSGDELRIRVSFDGQSFLPVSYKTSGRTEEWKLNVLRNQAIRTFRFASGKQQAHRLRVTAMDEGVVVDQVMIFKNKIQEQK